MKAIVSISLVILLLAIGLVNPPTSDLKGGSNRSKVSGSGDNLYLPTSAVMSAVFGVYNNSEQNAYNWYNFSNVPSPSTVAQEIAQQVNATLPTIESYMGGQNASNLSLELDGNQTLVVATISFVDDWITWSDGVEYTDSASWSGPVGGSISGPLVIPPQANQIVNLLTPNQNSGGCTPNGGSTSCNWAGMGFYPSSINQLVVTEASGYNLVMQVPNVPGCNGGNCQLNVPPGYVSPGGNTGVMDGQIANWVSLTGCSGGIGTGPTCGIIATGYFADITNQAVPTSWHPGQSYFPNYPNSFPVFWGMEGQGLAGLRGMHPYTGYCGRPGAVGVVYPSDNLFVSVYKVPTLYYWYQTHVIDNTALFTCSVLTYAYSGQWGNGQFFPGFTPLYADFVSSAPFMANHVQQAAWFWTAWNCQVVGGCGSQASAVFFEGGAVWTQGQSTATPCPTCSWTRYTTSQLHGSGLFNNFEMSQESTWTTAYPTFSTGLGPLGISGYVETNSWSANYDFNYV